MQRSDFGDQFYWGVSTAAYQIEGAHATDGKGSSIWDEFVRKKGKIYQGQHADLSTDYYHRYHQDLLLMKMMHIPNYRFSLSWSRLFPNGTGTINKKGVDFYNRVIDLCLELGIEPWITCYHWDLPAALQAKGGWTNRSILGWFEDYVSFCIQTFGDRVRHWMILNEPLVFCGAGYFLGLHAPGEKKFNSFLAAAHHATLCQASAARVAKSLNSQLQVGTTFSCAHVEPRTHRSRDREAAVKIDAALNRLFIEPVLGLGYPVKDLSFLRRMEAYMHAGDEAQMAFEMDFVGIQPYTREIARYDLFTPFLQANIVKATKRQVPLTAMHWEVYPPAIYHLLKKFSNYPNMPPIMVTENGAAFEDVLEDGQVGDTLRRQYLENHIAEVLKAKAEGVNVQGYFVWSFTDNFEWAEGYRPRFGIVHVDFTTQKRTVKQSGQWYASFLQSCR